MSTVSHRCGVIPPHLLKHLTHSDVAQRAARAQRTLASDAASRRRRALLADAAAETDEDQTPERTIYDAHSKETLPGEPVRGEDFPPSKIDADVNRAFDHLGSAYEFYLEVFGRDSLDGRGLPLRGTVHYGHEYANAFWDGNQMAFGDGDGELFNSFTTCLDVVAHELAHGVLQYTANLDYYGQAGALNEHVADVFGEMTVQYQQQQTVETADWLIGAGLFTAEVEGAALRSLKAPGTAYDDDVLGKDPQPAYMDDYVDTHEDNGGVHINSGIPNHAFYLVAAELGGHSWEHAGRIWYHALTQGGLPRDADFTAFAQATHAAAVNLYGEDSSPAVAVKLAWENVGVL